MFEGDSAAHPDRTETPRFEARHESESPSLDSRRARVEDFDEDEDDSGEQRRFVDPYPDISAGAPINDVVHLTAFEQYRAAYDSDNINNHWGPFADGDEWDLAKWLLKNVGQTQTDKFLKLGIVSVVLPV